MARGVVVVTTSATFGWPERFMTGKAEAAATTSAARLGYLASRGWTVATTTATVRIRIVVVRTT